MGEIVASVRVQVQVGDHLETRVITERFADEGNTGVLDPAEVRTAEDRIRATLAGMEGVEVVDLTTRIHIEVTGPAGAAGGRRSLDLPVGNLLNNGTVKLFGATGGCAPVGRWARSENWAPIPSDAARGMPEEAGGYHYTYYQEADRWDSVREMAIPGRIARVPDHVTPGSTNINDDIQLWDSGRNEWVRRGDYGEDGAPGGPVPPGLMYKTPERLAADAQTHAAARPESDWRFHSVADNYQYFDTVSGEVSRIAVGSAGGGRREILIAGQAFTDSGVWRLADSFDSVPAARPVVPLRQGTETLQYAVTGPTDGTGANAGYQMFTGTRRGSAEPREFRRRAATNLVPATDGRPEVPARPAGPLEVNMGTTAAPDWRVMGDGGAVGGAAPSPHPAAPNPPAVNGGGSTHRRVAPAGNPFRPSRW